MKRLEKALEALGERNLGCGLVVKPENIYYLTGFYPTAEAILLLREEPLLLVSRMDSRLAEAAGVEYKAVEKIEAELDLGYDRIGVEKDFISLEFYEKHLGGKEVQDLGFIQDMRRRKEKEEIKRMKEAARITLEVMGGIAEEMHGKTERELAALAEYRIKKKARPAFDVIVAAGRNSAVPHHPPGDEKIRGAVLLDMGAQVEHYNSDVTRTYFSEGEPELYSIVLEAQRAAVRECFAGNEVRKADLAAREVLREYGCEEYLLHSIGHGIGLEVHEPPRLVRDAEECFEEGMVVTVEPGVYREYGVRIEDMVLVKKRPVLLTGK